jgi:hypothetical protein
VDELQGDCHEPLHGHVRVEVGAGLPALEDRAQLIEDGLVERALAAVVEPRVDRDDRVVAPSVLFGEAARKKRS